MVPILVLLTFVVIASTYALVQRSKAKELAASLGMSGAPLPDYTYTPGHLWLDKLASGQFRLGLDELVAKFVGQASKIHLVDDGELVKEGEPLAILSRGNRDITLRAPVAMRVFKSNQSLRTRPETVNQDPYNKAWLYQVSIEDKERAVQGTFSGERAKAWMRQETERLKQFITATMTGPEPALNTAYDGGTLVEGLLAEMDENAVTDFEKQFLAPTRQPQ